MPLSTLTNSYAFSFSPLRSRSSKSSRFVMLFYLFHSRHDNRLNSVHCSVAGAWLWQRAIIRGNWLNHCIGAFHDNFLLLEHLRTRNFHSGAGHLSRSSRQTTCSSLRHSRNHGVQQAFGWCARHTAKRCRFHPWHFDDAFRSKNTSAKFTLLPVVGGFVKALMNRYTVTQPAAWILTPEEAKKGLRDNERLG